MRLFYFFASHIHHAFGYVGSYQRIGLQFAAGKYGKITGSGRYIHDTPGVERAERINRFLTPTAANVEVEYYFSAGVPDNTSARLTIATLNGAAFDQAYESWADNQLNINKFEDGYVKGHISVDEAGLMFTSIPYDSGWTAYVDGRKTDIQTVAGAFIALDLEKGDHVIEFKYFPRGQIGRAHV